MGTYGERWDGLDGDDQATSGGVWRIGAKETKHEKANRSQIGHQISQKYLPAVPLVMGTIEQMRKANAEKIPTT